MSHRKLGALLVSACALSSLAVPAVAPAASKSSRDVTVMTRNLYLGAYLIPLATQPSLEAFKQAAAQRFQTVLANDFPTRAKGIAAEIAKAKPDLVGLQEAAVWRRSPDGVTGAPMTDTTIVQYDSVKVLLSELAKRGAHYKVAVIRPWFDYGAPTAANFDVRLTQQDAILVRTGKGAKVKVRKTFKHGYSKEFDVPTQVGVAKSPRGWVGVDAKLGKRAFRFVETHLEAYSSDIANTQMKELLRKQLTSRKRETILVGDFNSDPKTAGSDRDAKREPSAYGTALDAGFFNPLPRRETCCQPEDLHKSGKLDQWIDHIVMRPKLHVVRSSIVGNKKSDRVGGLWPSDHAGIVATLRLK